MEVMQRQQQQHCPLTWMEGKGVEKRASERGKAEKTVFTPRRTPANDANWSRFVIDGLVRLSTVSSRRFNTHKTNLLPHPHFYKPSPLLPHRLTLQTWLWAIHINRTVSSWRHTAYAQYTVGLEPSSCAIYSSSWGSGDGSRREYNQLKSILFWAL